MHPVELTPDIWYLVVDVLGEELFPDNTSIGQLALTCKAMVSPCRRHLFKTINLRAQHPISLLEIIGLFHEIITHTPAIICYVRHLEHDIEHTDDVRLHQIFELLCGSAPLRSITLAGQGRCWDKFPRPLQIALEKLIQLPSLTTLSLSSMRSVPASILFRVGPSRITHIYLNEVEFTLTSGSHTVAVGLTRSTIRPTSLVAEPDSFGGLQLLMDSFGPLSGGAGIFDFSGLRDLEFFDIYSASCFEFVGRMLRVSRAVQSLNISTFVANFTAIPWEGLGASLSAPWTAETLTKLTLSNVVEHEDTGPLHDLVSELGIIAGNNNLEELFLRITLDLDFLRRVDSEDWSALASLLTRPGSFPRLKAVTMKIVTFGIHSQWDAESSSEVERNLTKLLETSDIEIRVLARLFGGEP